MLQIITIPTFDINIQMDHFNTKFHILNTLPTYKYIHFKTTFMCPRSIAVLPSSQPEALPGFLITAHHLCAFLLYLAPSKKKRVRDLLERLRALPVFPIAANHLCALML